MNSREAQWYSGSEGGKPWREWHRLWCPYKMADYSHRRVCGGKRRWHFKQWITTPPWRGGSGHSMLVRDNAPFGEGVGNAYTFDGLSCWGAFHNHKPEGRRV